VGCERVVPRRNWVGGFCHRSSSSNGALVVTDAGDVGDSSDSSDSSDSDADDVDDAGDFKDVDDSSDAEDASAVGDVLEGPVKTDALFSWR